MGSVGLVHFRSVLVCFVFVSALLQELLPCAEANLNVEDAKSGGNITQILNLSDALKEYDPTSLQKAIFGKELGTKKTDIGPEHCGVDERRLCRGVRASGEGLGRVAHCLLQYLERSKVYHVNPLTPVCEAALKEFRMQSLTYRTTVHDMFAVEPIQGMAQACKEDASSFCNQMRGSRLLKCLTMQLRLLSHSCKEKVKQNELQSARNPKLDVPFYAACRQDLQQKHNGTSCSEKRSSEWKHCLQKVAERNALSNPLCAQQLFDQMEAEAEDVRLNPALVSSCSRELGEFCKDVIVGEARMIRCLWDNTLNSEFTSRCQVAVLSFARAHLADYRLDYRIRTRCASDIDKHCRNEKAYTDKLPAHMLFHGRERAANNSVIWCLKSHYLQEATSLDDGCQEEMQRIIKIESISPVADPLVWDNCQTLIQKVCPKEARLGTLEELGGKAEVETRSQRLRRCLRTSWAISRQAKVLDSDGRCRNAMALQEALETRSVELKPLLRRACGSFLNHHCAGLDAETGKALACLQDKVDDEEMSLDCKQQVQEDIEATSGDYKLKYGVSRTCKADIDASCQVEKATGRNMLQCLVEHRQGLSSACQDEVFRVERLQPGSGNIEVDCRTEADIVCPDIEPGHGNIRDCLLKHVWFRSDAKHISSACTNAIDSWVNRTSLEASDVRMSPAAMATCGQEMENLCHDVEPGEAGSMWKCLEDHEDSQAMGRACHETVQYMTRLKNAAIDFDLDLQKACLQDAKELCKSLTRLPGAMTTARRRGVDLLTCLMERRKFVTNQQCSTALLRKAVQQAKDIRNNPQAEMACGKDIDRLCSKEEASGLDTTKCLTRHYKSISPACQQELYVEMRNYSSSFVLNPSLSKFCSVTAKRHCPDYDPDNSTVIECLLDHMHALGDMSPLCHKELVKEEEKRSRDLQFNPALQSACSADLTELQKSFPNDCPSFAQDRMRGQLIDCLVTHRGAVKADRCAEHIKKVMQRQSDDIRASRSLLRLCSHDLRAHCARVPYGRGLKQVCLRKHINNISSPCKEAVLKVQAAEGEDATLNPGVRRGCKNEMVSFCRGVQPGKARMLACLDLHKNRHGFSRHCRTMLLPIQIDQSMKAAAKKEASGEAAQLANDIGYLVQVKGTFGTWGLVAFAASVSWCTISITVLCAVVIARQMKGRVLQFFTRKVEQAEPL